MEIVLLIVLLVILLIVLAVVVFIAYIVLHKPSKKSDRKVVYRSRVISNPKYDLLTKEKFAIIRIFLFIMGSDEMLAKKVEANLILANMVDSLGIRPQDVTKLVKDDLGRNSENLAEEGTSMWNNHIIRLYSVWNRAVEEKVTFFFFFLVFIYNSLKNIDV